MLLESLTLADFRNFARDGEDGGVVVDIGPRFTVLHGHNGAGKTNLLEAIWFLSTLRSFRTSDQSALLRRDCSAARLELRGQDERLGIGTTLEVRLTRGTRSTRRLARADGKTVAAAADFYGRVQAVLFTPEDLAVLRGPPAGRRQFLDRMLFSRQRAHIADIQRYEKVVRARNRVLKDDHVASTERERLLLGYDEDLAATGARVWTRRADLCSELAADFTVSFERIHGASLSAEIEYRSALEEKTGPVVADERAQALREALLESRPRDFARRTTGVGPHRDELRTTLDGVEAADFASQGQTRALILAFKIAEIRAPGREGPRPILLLDDVSSELDPKRNAALFETLHADVGQCMLTTTAPHHVALEAGVDRRDLEVAGGRITAFSEGV